MQSLMTRAARPSCRARSASAGAPSSTAALAKPARAFDLDDGRSLPAARAPARPAGSPCPPSPSEGSPRCGRRRATCRRRARRRRSRAPARRPAPRSSRHGAGSRRPARCSCGDGQDGRLLSLISWPSAPSSDGWDVCKAYAKASLCPLRLGSTIAWDEARARLRVVVGPIRPMRGRGLEPVRICASSAVRGSARPISATAASAIPGSGVYVLYLWFDLRLVNWDKC